MSFFFKFTDNWFPGAESINCRAISVHPKSISSFVNWLSLRQVLSGTDEYRAAGVAWVIGLLVTTPTLLPQKKKISVCKIPFIQKEKRKFYTGRQGPVGNRLQTTSLQSRSTIARNYFGSYTQYALFGFHSAQHRRRRASRIGYVIVDTVSLKNIFSDNTSDNNDKDRLGGRESYRFALNLKLRKMRKW